jgi:hypothetical protein
MTSPRVVYTTRTAVATGTSAVATLPAAIKARSLYGLTVTGPSGSSINVYLGALSTGSRIDQSSRGQSNTADYSTPRPIPAGTPVLVEWPGQSAVATTCMASFAVSL